MAFNSIKDGEFTKTIYTMVSVIIPFVSSLAIAIIKIHAPKQIKDERFNEAITALVTIVDANPTVMFCIAF